MLEMQQDHTRYIIARHGETVLNREHRWQGMGDSPLTEDGAKQAEYLGMYLRNYNISRIITSKLPRAIETGRIVAHINGIRNISSSEYLNERNLGILEGLNSDEIMKKYAIDFKTITSRDIDVLERVEAWKPFVKRIFSYLEEIKREGYKGTTLLLTHGGVLRAIFNTLTNTYDQRVIFYNCSYMILHAEDENCTIESVNTLDYMRSR